MKIGEAGWVAELMALTRPLGAGFWSRFRLASKQVLAALEAAIGRRLPDEFHEFYRGVGYGRFEPGGRINSPSEILEMLGCAIWYSIGSLTPGQE